MEQVKIIECPRDAMQGISQFIPTEKKIAYLNQLLKVGFDILDFGSFVSPRAVPQLKDTAEVVDKLDLSGTKTKLLAIVANTVGGEMAAQHEKISFLGFPFSISPTFLQKNINSNMAKALITVNKLHNICLLKNKELLVYISLAFGNPYGDKWSMEIVEEWIDVFSKLGVCYIWLADTTGESVPETISSIFSLLIPKYPDIEFGFHLHTALDSWYDKIDAAYKNGCRNFDTVINGLGGCPFSGKGLIANLKTSLLMEYFEMNHVPFNINREEFQTTFVMGMNVFPNMKLNFPDSDE
ncbi:MAG: hypothetical protein J7L46_00075 [Bacteroidales bacterium]|nr:hypothetical protein [Bacteroidales bacterium]